MRKFVKNLYGILYVNVLFNANPFIELTEGRKNLLNSKIDRDILIENRYFKYFIDPLVRRLNYHAKRSKNCELDVCRGGGSTFVYRLGKIGYPLLTYGTEKHYETICKNECPICPTLIYNPFAVLSALIQLSMFETSSALFDERKN